MSRIRLSHGDTEDGVVTGNAYDKYGSNNLVVKRIMAGFEQSLQELIQIANPANIHEVGCGEGYWVVRWALEGRQVRGTDFSESVIAIAKENAVENNVLESLFTARSIYELSKNSDSADLVICCEVLEHLEKPATALSVLSEIAERYVILSVPQEPLWRVLNVLRGRYVKQLGNTPGHLNHWSRRDFVKLVSKWFDIVELRKPFPWSMVLCRPKK